MKVSFEGSVLLLPRKIHEIEVFLRCGLGGGGVGVVGFNLHTDSIMLAVAFV